MGFTAQPRKKKLIVTERPIASDKDGFTVDDPAKRTKDNDFRMWNIRTLNRPRAAERLAEPQDCYKANITAIQEVRWNGSSKRKMKSCYVYYGDCSRVRKQRLFGCGFVVSGRLRQEVLSFRHVNERLITIRIKGKFANISLISAYAPTKEKDDATKESFYKLLDKIYEKCPIYDVKSVLGDFNAKIGNKIGRQSLHDTTSGNGVRPIDFAAGRNVTTASTRFPNLNIHKGTWQTPDQQAVNQIDHVAIKYFRQTRTTI